MIVIRLLRYDWMTALHAVILPALCLVCCYNNPR